MHRLTKTLSVLFIILVLSLIGLSVYIVRSGYAEELGINFLPSQEHSLKVVANAPQAVKVGDEFRLVVNVRNNGKSFLTLSEIRLPAGLLKNVKVVQVFPQPTKENSSTAYLGYTFSYGMNAGEVLDFVFTLQAASPLEFTGKVVVVADTYQSSAQVKISAVQPEVAAISTPLPTPTWIPPVEFDKIPYQSVVQVTAMMMNQDGELKPAWSSSGAIISADGLILTSAEAVLPHKNFPVDALEVALTVQPNIAVVPAYYAEVVQADPLHDLAVLLITTDLKRRPVNRSQLKLPAVSLVNSDALPVGGKLNLLGYASLDEPTLSVNATIVDTTQDGSVPAENDFIHISATLPGGNSGGLAVNSQGQLVGMLTSQGFNGDHQFMACRTLVDTNRDGKVDEQDDCIPTGGRIDAVRPIRLAAPLIEAARQGEINILALPSPSIKLPAGKVMLFQDDFSDPKSGWSLFDNATGWAAYLNNEFHILVKKDHTLLTSTINNSFEDVVITVKTSILSQTGEGDRGAICRYKDPENYYYLAISEEGYFGIFKKVAAVYTPLLNWQYSPAITNYAPVTLTAACVGDTLTIAADGVVLGQVKDTAFSQGDIGLAAGAWSATDFGAAFSSLEVRSP
jgi:S1-C subfamily serine protease